LETAPNGVYYQDRFIPTGVFPVGIDPEKFDDLLTTPKVQARIAVHPTHQKSLLISFSLHSFLSFFVNILPFIASC
jgi:hypothetical protein